MAPATSVAFGRPPTRWSEQMGTLHFHHVLVDLRHAVIAPLPEALLVEAVSYLSRLGVGVVNRVAFVTDPADGVRWDRVQGADASRS